MRNINSMKGDYRYMNNEHFISYNADAFIGVELTVKTTYGTKSIKLIPGAFLEDLMYQDGTDMITVSGRVIDLGFEEISNPGVYAFTDTHKVTSIVLDASTNYHSDIRDIKINTIRDFDATYMVEEVKFEDVVVSNNCDGFYVAFRPSMKPTHIIDDNDQVIDFLDNEDGTYSIKVTNMTEYLSYRVIGVCGIGRLIVKGIEPSKEPMSIINKQMKDNFPMFMGSNTEVLGDSILYIPVLKNLTEPVTVGIATSTGTVEYTKYSKITLISQDGTRVERPVYKYSNGKLMIALPVLYAATVNGNKFKLVVNGWSVEINLGDVILKTPWSVSAVKADPSVDGYSNRVSFTKADVSVPSAIIHSKQHSSYGFTFDLVNANYDKLVLTDKMLLISRYADGKLVFKVAEVATVEYNVMISGESLGSPYETNNEYEYELSIIIVDKGIAKTIVTVEEDVK